MTAAADCAPCLNPDKAIESTYGTGRYQLRVLLLVGSIYVSNFPAVQIQVFVGEKMARDETIPAFTPEVVRASQSLLFVGWGLGAVFTGLAVDRFGRRVLAYGLNLGLALAYFCSVLAASANCVLIFKASLLVAGFCINAVTAAYVLVQESLPSRFRVRATVAMNLMYSAGLGVMALICGYVTRDCDWRVETILFFSPHVLLTLGAPLVRESLHMLVRRGRCDEAVRAARAIASSNRARLDLQACMDSGEGPATPLVESRNAAAGSPAKMLAAPPLRLRLVMSLVCWVACTLGYYGLSFSASKLSSDIYLNVFAFALADVVGYLLPARLVPLLGRRRCQVFCLALAAAFLVLCGAVPRESPLLTACAVAGRLLIDMAFSTAYIITVEAFPTGCRTTAMGLCSGASRLFGLFAPLAATLPAALACPLYGATCALGALATCALPETQAWQLSQPDV